MKGLIIVAATAAAVLGAPTVAAAQEITFSFGGAAQGSHTGPGSFSGTGSVSGTASCTPGSGPEVEQQTMTAASGDTVDELTNGNLCQQPGPVFVNTATYTITGGTGRFADATGSGTYVSVVTFPNGFPGTGFYSFTQQGTISLNRGNSPGHPEPFDEQGSGPITFG